jgi:hypothetical protein
MLGEMVGRVGNRKGIAGQRANFEIVLATDDLADVTHDGVLFRSVRVSWEVGHAALSSHIRAGSPDPEARSSFPLGRRE